MKIFVTGGNGFIGTHIVSELVNRGINVISFDLVNPVKQIEGVEYHIGTIMDEVQMGRLMKSCNAVFHLAAILGVKRADTELLRCLTVNIEGSFSVFRAASMAGIKRILLTSSSEIFGDISEQKLNEIAPYNPKSGYAVSKLAAEYGLKGFCREYEVDYNVVRYFNVYGPGQVAEFVVPRFIKMVQEGLAPTIYGEGNQVRSFCHISDAVRATVDIFLDEFLVNTEFNIGNDLEPITIKELANLVCQQLGSNVQPIFKEFSESDRLGSREIYKRVPDITKLRNAIGYEPSLTLLEGMKTIIEAGMIPTSWADPLESTN